jgi:hypothetical protein
MYKNSEVLTYEWIKTGGRSREISYYACSIERLGGLLLLQRLLLNPYYSPFRLCSVSINEVPVHMDSSFRVRDLSRVIKDRVGG